MKIGSKVRLIGIPDGLEDYPDLLTKTTFEKCIGHEFVIAGFNEVGMAELGIKSVTGNEGEKIWVESRFLELVSYSSPYATSFHEKAGPCQGCFCPFWFSHFSRSAKPPLSPPFHPHS